uniref:USP8 dimerisation domain-containing protein n=1 Tax=Neogobius melanostomus TaxID=47308 RepID=A0A8C6SJS3_9GOBI
LSPEADVLLSPEADVLLSAGETGRAVEVDQELNPRLYLRSGLDMERMASVYHQEGSLENAYVLYNKFITLFVEKLPSHRDYHQCSSSPEKDVAFPRREELKKRLEEKYSSEYTDYLTASSLPIGSRSGGRGQWLRQSDQRVADSFLRFEEQLQRQETAIRERNR